MRTWSTVCPYISAADSKTPVLFFSSNTVTLVNLRVCNMPTFDMVGREIPVIIMKEESGLDESLALVEVLDHAGTVDVDEIVVDIFSSKGHPITAGERLVRRKNNMYESTAS